MVIVLHSSTSLLTSSVHILLYYISISYDRNIIVSVVLIVRFAVATQTKTLTCSFVALLWVCAEWTPAALCCDPDEEQII